VSIMTVLVFAAVALLWAAFSAALLHRESADSTSGAFRAAPVPVQVVEGVVLLPCVLGLAVWEASWALGLRLRLVAGLAWVTVYAFAPWHAR
jgi:hypothetical protein